MNRKANRRRKIILMTVRMPLGLKTTLDNAAEQNNRSLTQEIESRLEHSFFTEQIMGGPETASILHDVRQGIHELEARSSASWMSDVKVWTNVSEFVRSKFSSSLHQALAGNEVTTTNRRQSKSDNLEIVSVRCTSDLKERLDRRSKRNGHSLAKEIVERLELSVSFEQTDSQSPTNSFIYLIGVGIWDMELRAGASWHDDDALASQVQNFVQEELLKRRPPLVNEGEANTRFQVAKGTGR